MPSGENSWGSTKPMPWNRLSMVVWAARWAVAVSMAAEHSSRAPVAAPFWPALETASHRLMVVAQLPMLAAQAALRAATIGRLQAHWPPFAVASTAERRRQRWSDSSPLLTRTVKISERKASRASYFAASSKRIRRGLPKRSWRDAERCSVRCRLPSDQSVESFNSD